jgi:hypothetical protein
VARITVAPTSDGRIFFVTALLSFLCAVDDFYSIELSTPYSALLPHQITLSARTQTWGGIVTPNVVCDMKIDHQLFGHSTRSFAGIGALQDEVDIVGEAACFGCASANEAVATRKAAACQMRVVLVMLPHHPSPATVSPIP